MGVCGSSGKSPGWPNGRPRSSRRAKSPEKQIRVDIGTQVVSSQVNIPHGNVPEVKKRMTTSKFRPPSEGLSQARKHTEMRFYVQPTRYHPVRVSTPSSPAHDEEVGSNPRTVLSLLISSNQMNMKCGGSRRSHPTTNNGQGTPPYKGTGNCTDSRTCGGGGGIASRSRATIDRTEPTERFRPMSVTPTPGFSRTPTSNNVPASWTRSDTSKRGDTFSSTIPRRFPPNPPSPPTCTQSSSLNKFKTSARTSPHTQSSSGNKMSASPSSSEDPEGNDGFCNWPPLTCNGSPKSRIKLGETLLVC